MNSDGNRFRLGRGDSASRIVACIASLGNVDRLPARKVSSRFFDTFDWRLYGSGKAISVGPGRQGPEIQIFEKQGDRLLGAVPGDLSTGFSSDFPEGRLRDLVQDIIGVRRLLPRLDLISQQTVIALRDGEGKSVLRLAVETCSAQPPDGKPAKRLGTYLTMEAVRGYGGAYEKARKQLENRFALGPAEKSLYLDGLQAIGVTPGDYSSKLQLALEPAMTAAEASRLIHLTLLDTLSRNETGAAGNIDPEFLHDFRVAGRRIRSALAQLDKGVLPPAVIARAKTDFRWICQQTNHMRDLDVYLIDFPDLQDPLPDSYRPHLKPFHEFLSAQSRKEARRVAAMLRGRRYRKICDDWRTYLTVGFGKDRKAEFTDTPVRNLADARIWRAFRRALKEGATIGVEAPAEALHALRISCKKLRYLLEFFQSLYPPDEIGVLIRSLKKLQDVLGEFQDSEIQSLAIVNFGREMAAANRAPVETQMAMGMVAESILRRQGAARSAFHGRFEAFSGEEIVAAAKELFRDRE